MNADSTNEICRCVRMHNTCHEAVSRFVWFQHMVLTFIVHAIGIRTQGVDAGEYSIFKLRTHV